MDTHQLLTVIEKGFSDLRTEIETKFADVRTEMQAGFANFRTEIDERFARGFAEQRAYMDKGFAEQRTYMDGRFAKIEDEAHQTRILVEDLRDKLKWVDEGDEPLAKRVSALEVRVTKLEGKRRG